MPEIRLISDSIAKDNKSAYHRAKDSSGAYIVRGNSIVKRSSDGSVKTVKSLSQVKVRLKTEEKVIVIK